MLFCLFVFCTLGVHPVERAALPGSGWFLFLCAPQSSTFRPVWYTFVVPDKGIVFPVVMSVLFPAPR
jgi:hypothetical protein